MSENFRKKNPAGLDNSRELEDDMLEQVAGGVSGDRYMFVREETRHCSWCGNTGPWEVYASVNNASDEIAMCKTCGNAGYRP